MRSVNDKGDSWWYSISIMNSPRRRFLGKEVISTGKGDRSVVGHVWWFSRSDPSYCKDRAGMLGVIVYLAGCLRTWRSQGFRMWRWILGEGGEWKPPKFKNRAWQ
jgi:hypothetical protein